MRMVFARPFSFTPASRIFYSGDDRLQEPLAHLRRRADEADAARLRDPQAGVAARVDGGKGREVHVDVQGESMVGPDTRHPYAERRDLGTLHIDSRRAWAARRLRADEINDRLLEQPNEGLHLDVAAAEIDEGVEHDLPGTVIGHFAATIGADHRDAIGDLHRCRALAESVHRR